MGRKKAARLWKRIRAFRYKRIFFVLLAPVALLCSWLASTDEAFCESFFSLGIYRVISQVFSTFFGVFPISVGELLVVTLPVVTVTLIVRCIVRAVKQKKERKQLLLRGGATLVAVAACVFFVFTICCGVNYYRRPFTYYSGLELRDSSAAELKALCADLIADASAFRQEVKEDRAGVMRLSENEYKTSLTTRDAFSALAEEYDVLGGLYARPKPVILSRGMSYLNITGIFFPFTLEANVNVDAPDYTVPATMCHEQTHLRGFMREDEANFIAYLACMASGNADLQYSGTMLALTYSMNALYDADREGFRELRSSYSEGMNRDISAKSEYWKQFETPVASVSTSVNNSYLQSQGQEDGVKSYGRMVDLMLAYHRKTAE